MSINFLHWNLGKNDNSELIASCLVENDVDFASFSEWRVDDLMALEALVGDSYYFVNGKGGCDKIRILVRRSCRFSLLNEQTRYMVGIAEKAGERIVLASTHLPDRRSNPDPMRRLDDIEGLISQVHRIRRESGVSDTVVIGDFNANPYDVELLSPKAFNAMLFKDVLRTHESRIWNGVEYEYMYNPVLDWLSEETSTYGSVYYSAGAASPIWNCLDQAVVSKGLMDRVSNFEYLRTVGDRSLMAKVAPDKRISDHLPLLVGISESE